MKILMVSTEMTPLARTGGLGDVVEGLSAQLQKRGHEISIVLPFYRALRENPQLTIRNTEVKITVHVGAKRMEAGIFECTAPNGVQLFLVRRHESFDRSGLYGVEGLDYDDNVERFVFFSRVAVELARHMSPAPDVLHVHDWQAALVPAFVKERGLPFGTVLTIHNLAYQGSFWGVEFGLTNLPGSYFSSNGLEHYGRMNFLKGGIVFADEITTVSEHYCREIQSPEAGCGLDGILRTHAEKLTGILNGADYSLWNPAHDPALQQPGFANYRPEALEGKAECRKALLAELDLAPDPRGPVFAMVSRLAQQKGIDLVIPLLDRLLADDVRLVILGEGEETFERELFIASRKHVRKFVFRQGFDDPLAHQIFAGADALLIPSHFEPCGENAMYTLKYGTPPIARNTGGLFQMIQDYDPTSSGQGNGFVFFDATPEALWDAIGRAKKLFANPEEWRGLMARAMAADFSWPAATECYERVYASAKRKTGGG